ncbi:LAQU0S02e08922g1_1 [Lachancea quebecensis]|uniref:LAQU0S02e08922g1_1 n=1 Tax=Lachancea quebecensis TaxID=1654605 RepID=A0A0P1KP10_9SACH|nr:LAQU0S02e08922g1_1 [Lachancea quebecensis]
MPVVLVSYSSFKSLASLPWQFVVRVYRGGLNRRNIPTLAFNFALNFFPVFLWLTIFKNAGLIPTGLRPRIHSQFAFLADVFMFGDSAGELVAQYGAGARLTAAMTWLTSTTFALAVLVAAPLGVWYYLYYKRRLNYNVIDPYAALFHRNQPFSPTAPRAILPFFFFIYTFVGLNAMHLLASQSEDNFTKNKDLLAWTSYVLLHLLAPIFTAVYLYVFHPPGTLKAFSLAMGLQNICGVFSHLLVPMAPPWFVHMYGINDTEHVSYEQEGFAAGLTRVDSHLGTHLNSKGFHKSPIVFGAVPSLHSAIALQCFLFLITRATSTKANFATANQGQTRDFVQLQEPPAIAATQLSIPKDPESFELDSVTDVSLSPSGGSITPPPNLVYATPIPEAALNSKWLRIFHIAFLPRFLGTAFPLLQWWSTMYLDHHFRFDLFVGMCYAVTSFLIVNRYYLQPRVLKRWCNLRMGIEPDTRKEAKTMGMRVFENTNVEWFFDPFA